MSDFFYFLPFISFWDFGEDQIMCLVIFIYLVNATFLLVDAVRLDFMFL